MKPCIVCGEPNEATRCNEHQQTGKVDRPRDSVTRRNRRPWKNLSRRLRALQPWCSACGTADDLTVDHIIPVTKGGAEYALDNLDVLCRPCNSEKSDQLDQGEHLGRADWPTPGKPQTQMRMVRNKGENGSQEVEP